LALGLAPPGQASACARGAGGSTSHNLYGVPRLPQITEEKDTAAAIRHAGGLLGHFHASESDRGELGTGQVRWKKIFAALKEIRYDGWVTIESFATGIVDLCAAACIWRPIYESADQLAVDGLAFLKRHAAKA